MCVGDSKGARLVGIAGEALEVLVPFDFASPDALPPVPPVMVTAAQFMKNCCSRLNHVHAKMISPFGRSEGTVNGKVWFK